MPDYKEMYLTLFRSQAKAIELLLEAQKTTEELYISENSSELILLEGRNDLHNGN